VAGAEFAESSPSTKIETFWFGTSERLHHVSRGALDRAPRLHFSRVKNAAPAFNAVQRGRGRNFTLTRKNMPARHRAFMEYSDKEHRMWARWKKMLVSMTSPNPNEAETAQTKVKEFSVKNNLKWEDRPRYLRGMIEDHFPSNKFNGQDLSDLFHITGPAPMRSKKTAAAKAKPKTAKKPALLTAAQVKKSADKPRQRGTPIGELHYLGREIRGRIERLDVLGGKTVNMKDSIDRLLADAAKLCDRKGFEGFQGMLLPRV
jgi:hypothetical protein